MVRLPAFSPRLDDRLSAEFLEHSLTLLPHTTRQNDAMLDAWALRFERPEPPRDPDLPLLEAKTYPRVDSALMEETIRSLLPPPPLEGFIGRKAELDQAVIALLADQPVVITGESGVGKTALLRQLAHDPRLRKQFKRVWWLDDLKNAGTIIGIALNAPGVLRANPADQPKRAREFLIAAGVLLLVDHADDVAPALDFTPTVAVVGGSRSAAPSAAHIQLGGLPSETGIILLSRLSNQPDAVTRPLAGLVNYHPQAIELIATLLVEDGIPPQTISEFLNGVNDNRVGALYNASYEALPEAYQILCQAFAASPRQWINVNTVLNSYEKPIAAQRALTYIERHRFVERFGEAVRVTGRWTDSVPAAEKGFEPIPSPVTHFGADDHDTAASKSLELHRYGIALMDEGRDEESVIALTEALKLRQVENAEHAVAETLIALARLAYLRGDDFNAIRRLEEAAEHLHSLRDEDSLEVVRIALSRVYRRAGRLDAALSVLGDEAPPEDLTAVYRAREEWDNAIAVYERWLERRPELLYALAETLALAGRYDDALDTIAGNDAFEFQWLRAMIHHMQGNVKKALDHYRRLQPNVPPEWRSPFARAYSRALAATGEAHQAALLVGAEGIWYEAKLSRPVFARQKISLALHAHFLSMIENFDEAETVAQHAQSVVGERPDPDADVILWRAVARVAWHRGELDKALKAFDNEITARGLLRRRDDHEIGTVLHCMADLQRERGDLDRAIANYRRALTHKDPTRDRRSVGFTRLALRDVFAQLGREAETIEAGQQAVELLVNHPEIDLHLLGYAMANHVHTLAAAGRDARSTQVFSDWLSQLAQRTEDGLADPFWPIRLLTIGLYLRSLPANTTVDPALLLDIAGQAILVAENEASGTSVAWAARRDLGYVYLRLERWQDAYSVFAPLLADPRVGETAPFVALAAHMGSARAMSCLDESQESIRHFEAARQFEPDIHARGLITREAAEMYRNLGDDEHAAERYLEALESLQREKSMPAYIDTIVALAYARLRLRRFGDAIDTFEQALKVVENQPDPPAGLLSSVLFDMATAHHTLGQYRRAASTYQRALSHLDPRRMPERCVETQIAMAHSYVAAEAYQQAVEAYHDALQFDILAGDQRRTVLMEQADVFEQLGLLQAAVDTYRAALSLDGGTAVERASIHRGLGTLYTRLNNFGEARLHFEAVLAEVRDEQTGLTLRAVGDSYRAQGELQEAINNYKQALAQLDRAVYPIELAATNRAIGEIYLGFGQGGEALTYLGTALEIERGLPQQDGGRIVNTLQSLAQAHEQRGELELAIRRHHEAMVYQDVRHAPEDYVKTLWTLGRLYSELEGYDDAAKAFEEALATETRHPEPDTLKIAEMNGSLGDVYRAQGRLESAADLYKKTLAVATISTPLREHVTQQLKLTQAEITKHLEALKAADESWMLLTKVAKPDLKGLAFVRALQAQVCAALGRREESEQRLAQLMKLLKDRRSELKLDDPRSIMRALAMLLRAEEQEAANHHDNAVQAYKHALDMAAHDEKKEGALVWAVRQKANKAGIQYP